MLTWKCAPQLAFLVLFALSRIGVHAAGVAPDPHIVVDHWQHIDLRLLASDPIGSLWSLHAQPPLWNGILAMATAVVGPDGEAVTRAIFGFNIALSACAGLLALSVLRTFGFPRFAAAALALAAMCSPNVIYFEATAFYPHFTFFLVTLLVWLLLQVRREGPLWPVGAALGVLVALSWTWAIFHPAFVGLFAAALAVWSRGWTLAARPAFAMAALALCVASLPTLKNAATYGYPSASTWIGMNLAQTVPGGQSGELVRCDFETAHRAAIAAPAPSRPVHPLLTQAWKDVGMPNMNHIGMVDISKECLGLARQAILHNPVGWIQQRLESLAGSHQLAPSNYGKDPLGWDRVMGSVERAYAQLGSFGRAAMIAWYIVLCWFAIRSIRSNPPFYLCLVLFIVYFTLASHIMNGGEQARMRYTLEPIYLFLAASLLAAALRRFAPKWRLWRSSLSDAGA